MERLPQGEQAAEPIDEGFLAALGVHRIAIPVPFVEAGGPVNACAVENDDRSFTLFDTGVATKEGLEAMRAGLARLGIPVSHLSRIVVSHGHVDHYGNAQTLSEESGAPVYLHPGDLEKVCGDGRWFLQLQEHWSYFQRLGVPEQLLEEIVEGTRGARTHARQVEPHRIRPLVAGGHLRFRRFDAEVLHLPGHTPGLVCLYASAQRLLFADDHLLARVSPNPLLDFGQGEGAEKFRALARYLESAQRVYQLDLDCVIPGHGPSFRGHRPLLDGLFDFYARRQAKLVARLQQGPASVFELLAHLFPRYDAGRMYLMLSEVMGNLEVLEDRGLIRRDASLHFSLVPDAHQ